MYVNVSLYNSLHKVHHLTVISKSLTHCMLPGSEQMSRPHSILGFWHSDSPAATAMELQRPKHQDWSVHSGRKHPKPRNDNDADARCFEVCHTKILEPDDMQAKLACHQTSSNKNH